MRMVVTGATGYIGTHLTSLARKRGHDVVMASRQQPATSTESWLHFDLTADEAVALPAGTQVVVHLAANTSPANVSDERLEVVASQRLIKSALEAGAKFIFVSSQTARVDAPTAYGRIKWRIEQDVLATGGWVVRPGQVYGGELRGLFGTLAMLVLKLPLLPAFIPEPRIQPIHVDDLAEGLLRIAERDDVQPGVFSLASSEPVPFSSFLSEIARSRLHRKRAFIPAPVFIINAFSAVIGGALRTRFGLDRQRSLFDLPQMDTAADLLQLELVLRSLHSGMHRSGCDRRRRLLREGRALFIYVLREVPGGALLRRYARATEQMRDGRELGLPSLFLDYPILLSLIGKSSWTEDAGGIEFSWRLDAATMLAEASTAGARRFMGLGCSHGTLRSWYSLSKAVAGEMFWRGLRLLLSPMVRMTVGRARCVL